MNIVGESKMACYGKFPKGKVPGCCMNCNVAVECYEATKELEKADSMIGTEGICDDCNGILELIKDNVWYCSHCDMYLEWDPIGMFYTLVEEE